LRNEGEKISWPVRRGKEEGDDFNFNWLLTSKAGISQGYSGEGQLNSG